MSESEITQPRPTAQANDHDHESDHESTDGRRESPSRERLLELIVDCYDDLDRIDPPEVTEVAEHSGVSYRVYERAGRWNDLLREAGVPTLPMLVDEWIAAYIEAGYSDTREFRTSRLVDDFDSSSHRLSRNALSRLVAESEAERIARGRKVDLSKRDDVGEHSAAVWVGELRGNGGVR